MLDVALREAAVICQALADGRQSLLLLKRDTNSTWEFGEGPTRFWLWPTFDDRQARATKPGTADLVQQALRDRAPDGSVRVTHFADVAGIYHVQDEIAASAISPLHVWSDDAVRELFNSSPPGLVVVPVRVYRAGWPVELPEKAGSVEYDRWTFLDRPLETMVAEPVLSGDAFREVVRKLEAILKPTAMA